MKKKIIGVAVLATIVISAAAWNFNQGKNETKLNDIALANVEALATPELATGVDAIDCSNYWEGGMDGGMVRVCACSSGSKTLFCM